MRTNMNIIHCYRLTVHVTLTGDFLSSYSTSQSTTGSVIVGAGGSEVWENRCLDETIKACPKKSSKTGSNNKQTG